MIKIICLLACDIIGAVLVWAVVMTYLAVEGVAYGDNMAAAVFVLSLIAWWAFMAARDSLKGE